MLRALILSVLPFVLPALPLVLPGAPLPAQEPAPAETPPAALQVEVPVFPNATCPIMGKKVSLPLFVDTELGRFYVCCKPCYKKVLRDVALAHKTAYPVVEPHDNTVCPVSGEPIGEAAVGVTLQGHRFQLCCSGCLAAARAHAQVTLTRLLRPTTVDVGNATCPVSGKPVTVNAFALIGNHLVHLSSPTLVDDVAKEPAAVLQRAQDLARAQPGKPPHVHEKPQPKAPPAADAGNDKGGGK